jgi:hypothetical protein
VDAIPSCWRMRACRPGAARRLLSSSLRRGADGPRGVEADLALEPDRAGHDAGKRGDGGVATDADIDGVTRLLTLTPGPFITALPWGFPSAENTARKQRIRPVIVFSIFTINLVNSRSASSLNYFNSLFIVRPSGSGGRAWAGDRVRFAPRRIPPTTRHRGRATLKKQR